MTHPVGTLMYDKGNREYVEKHGKPYDYSVWHEPVGTQHPHGAKAPSGRNDNSRRK